MAQSTGTLTNNAATKHPICTKRILLNNGREIPLIGLGTWQGQYGAAHERKLKDSIIHALRYGYRMIDTAQYYGVENVVGDAIRSSGVPREEITVITKFWCHRNHEPDKALEDSLSAMKLDYIDILMMHWPTTMSPDQTPMAYPGSPSYVESWKLMEKLIGPRCRSVGVSNFTMKLLDELLKEASIIPVVNEIELHAQNPNLKLVPYCQGKGIQVISWSTLGSERQGQKNPMLTDLLFLDISKAHSCSPAVVSLSWAVQRNIIVIPKSSSVSRIEENIGLVTLSDQELETVNQAHLKLGQVRLSDTIPGMRYNINGEDTLMGWSREDFGFEDSQGNWLC